MRLTVVGCSGSMPGPHSPASCYLLEAEGFRLVVDLGNGAVGGLQRYTALNRVDAVALSPIPVYAPAGAAERIARANDDPDVTGVFDFVTLTPGRHLIGPFSRDRRPRRAPGRDVRVPVRARRGAFSGPVSLAAPGQVIDLG